MLGQIEGPKQGGVLPEVVYAGGCVCSYSFLVRVLVKRRCRTGCRRGRNRPASYLLDTPLSSYCSLSWLEFPHVIFMQAVLESADCHHRTEGWKTPLALHCFENSLSLL